MVSKCQKPTNLKNHDSSDPKIAHQCFISLAHSPCIYKIEPVGNNIIGQADLSCAVHLGLAQRLAEGELELVPVLHARPLGPKISGGTVTVVVPEEQQKEKKKNCHDLHI